MKRAVMALSILGALSLAGRAGAEDAATKKFADGTRASARQDWAVAAALFEESIRITPSVGAYFNRGYCLEMLGRDLEAYRDYREAERLARVRDDVRADTAHVAAAKILPRLHYVDLDVPSTVAREPGLRILVDGVEVSESMRRETLFSDSPTHKIVVNASGRASWEHEAPDHATVHVELGPAAAVPDQRTSPRVTAPPTFSTWRIVGGAAAGAGIATLAVSTGIFISGSNHQDELNSTQKSACSGATATGPCQQAHSHAVQYRSDIATTTTVLDVVGGVLVAAGAALFFVGPSDREQRASIAPMFGDRTVGVAFTVHDR